jgi:hypothetical protein
MEEIRNFYQILVEKPEVNRASTWKRRVYEEIILNWSLKKC